MHEPALLILRYESRIKVDNCCITGKGDKWKIHEEYNQQAGHSGARITVERYTIIFLLSLKVPRDIHMLNSRTHDYTIYMTLLISVYFAPI